VARLEPGDEAPDFSLEADDGSTVRLSDLRGGTVVVYFYPKAGTSGCTAQACEFRDRRDAFAAAGATVLGVSPDPVAAIVRFKAKEGLNFPLLSDPDQAAAQAYGVWVEKSMYGRTYMGVERSTFVVGPDGRLVRADYKVKSKGNAEETLGAVRA
jgi:peroxiredoxin Q/BCP